PTKLILCLTLSTSLLLSACNQANNQTDTNKGKKEPDKPRLNVKTLTIHGKPAISGKNPILTIVDADTVVKDNVILEFEDADAPTVFTISPDPFTPEKDKSKILTISTAETEKYQAWNIKVEIKRKKTATDPKTIDDVVDALRAKSGWIDGTVSEDINLLKTVEGFPEATVEWKSLNQKRCDDAGKIKKDIANVKVELKATIKWNGKEKEVTFSTIIERIKQIRFKMDKRGKLFEAIWDFSEENMLSYLEEGKKTAQFELKSVDIEKKQFVAQLKKKAKSDGSLVELENWTSGRTEDQIKNVEYLFGDKYVSLKKQTTITWEEYKAYLIGISRNDYSSKTDEQIFDSLKHGDLYDKYQGSWAEFNALSNDQKTKVIKDGLESSKEYYVKNFGVPKDTPDAEFAKKTKEILLAQEKGGKEFLGAAYSYEYEIADSTDPNYLDKLKLETVSMYDSKREWYSQKGNYTYDAGSDKYIKLFVAKLSEKLSITIQDNIMGFRRFRGECPISTTFTLTKTRGSETLNCTVSDIQQDGKLTLTTTGGFTGTYNMSFMGSSIDSLVF
ncbi:MAG: hypothetical protein ACTTKH_04895, partial [Treponema sp.]